ncbi:hypothetical protein [Streptomyces sp. NPDC047868]|uniref:hypothetical protein n=1 Tax=Streptomyces sp. NPDC047868 TaxID=3155480 RepID=UPI0034541BA2
MRTRTVSSLAFTAVLAIGAVIAAPSDAHGATGPVYSGTGWKIAAPNITHIDTKPWTIAFHDTKSRTKLTPYLKNVAAELTSYLGVKFTVTTKLVPVTRGKCVTGHVISYRYMSKPNPDVPNQSFAGSCGNKARAADGAYVFINSDYWAPRRRFPEPVRMNVIWHESAHGVGLNHPATCPKDKAGRQPLMCANTYNDLRTRRYSSFEATAFRQLVRNRTVLSVAVGER